MSVIFLLPIAYLQQTILLPQMTFGTRFSTLLLRENRKLYLWYVYTIYLASILTLIINIIGISFILSIVYGSKWIYYALLLTTLLWTIDEARLKSLTKIFTALALALAIYIALFVVELPLVVSRIKLVTYTIDFIDLMALWGAAAAPYSLLLQELEEDSYESIYIGTIFSILIGISISFVAYTTLYPCREFTIASTLEPFSRLGEVVKQLYLLGLLGSVVVSSLSILYTLKIALRLGGRVGGKGVQLSVVDYTMIALVASTIPIAILFGATNTILYTKIILYGSMFIGFLFSLTLVSITILYLRIARKTGLSIYYVNTFFLSILTTVTLYLSASAFYELL